MSTTTTGQDILELLARDHQEAKLLLERVDAASPDEREELFWDMVPALVSHEVAEEIVVYPTIRSEAPDGDAEADARIKEQSEAEEQLARMESLDRGSVEFATEMHVLHQAVLEHAQAEEEHIFPLLRNLEDPEERRRLGARYEKAKASAPTRPHPNAPDTPPGNKLLGPIAALFDKARDSARSS